MKGLLKKHLSQSKITELKTCYFLLRNWFQKLMYPYGRFVKTPLKLKANAKNPERRLEIGPGSKRIAGFETLNVVWDWHVDYVVDASGKLPFPEPTFDLIYASHVLEHIPWYQVQDVLKEWVRLLKPGGQIEVWVPDGYKIAKAILDFEERDIDNSYRDGWYRLNPTKDPLIWASARIFSYGDGTGRIKHPNWHRTLFTPRLLKSILSNAGLTKIRPLTSIEVRGHDHGWINLGMTGIKP